ncbi:isocitrate lyase/phosphoenolpyruvate mutase family protein [Paenibacillus rhizoplanae]
MNARTDVFLETPADEHNEAHLEAVLQRVHAYAAAGAHGIFLCRVCVTRG